MIWGYVDHAANERRFVVRTGIAVITFGFVVAQLRLCGEGCECRHRQQRAVARVRAAPGATGACAHCRRDRAVHDTARPDHTAARRSWGALSAIACDSCRRSSPSATAISRPVIAAASSARRAADPADSHRHCLRRFRPEHALLRVPTDLPSLASSRYAQEILVC
jgi:uncharacterized membrane protein YidH (DUF202 family)